MSFLTSTNFYETDLRKESLKWTFVDMRRVEVRYEIISANVLYARLLNESSGIEKSSLKNENGTSEWFSP